MPSFVLGGAISGGINLLSGNYRWSGQGPIHPVGSVQLKADKNNSGFVYVALSGGITILSGGLNLSGGPNFSGGLDGWQLSPGDTYTIPRLGIVNYLTSSGSPSLFVAPDAACSGQARVYLEVF